MLSWIKTKALPAILIVAGVIFALYIRSIFFPILNKDSNTFLIPWYNFIQTNGFFTAFSQKFYDYNPPYVYLIGLVTFLPWIPKLTAIKLISVLFDFVAAAAGYKIAVHLKKGKKWGWLAFLSVLLAPTVFIESGLWGQCDIIYTAFLLWMAYALLCNKPRQALFFFSLAFVFKSQAVFLGPIILLLLLKRKLHLFDLWIPIAVYFISLLPALIAGCPLIILLKTYFTQISVYQSLSMNAPNIFYLFSDEKYYSHISVLIGLFLAGVFTVFFIVYRMKIPAQPKPQIVLWDASFFGFFIPFLLPEMHERYFFTFALFILLMAFLLDTKALIAAFLAQVASVFSYLRFLYAIPVNLSLIAFFINLVLAVWIFILYWKRINSTFFDSEPGSSTNQITI